MAEVESLLRERGQLMQQNEQVKAKYKKSLQELMHILKVNKSLKECLDSHSRNLDNALAQQHAEQLAAYHQQLAHYKEALAQQTQIAHNLQQNVSELQEQLARVQAHVEQMQQREGGKEGEAERGEWNWGERQALLAEAERLREKVRQVTGELLAERERYRSDIFSKETEMMRSKESEYEKLRTIESKYQLLESELHNYKTAEKYLQQEAASVLDEETLYNSIRQQLTRISQDFNKYQLQSSNLLLKKREEEAQRNRRIAELEKENGKLKEAAEVQATQLKEALAESGQAKALQERLKVLQGERDQALQKAHVLQALTLTERHRAHSGISQRIREFETRVQLLLQEGAMGLQGGQGVQQVIVLKGYIRELSELLSQARKKEEHTTRKHQQQKEKWTAAEQAYRAKQEELRGRIKGYDALVAKLYAALEEKLKERLPEQMEKEFNMAIAHYEQKMMQMSEEIIKLRARITELQQARDHPPQEQKISQQAPEINKQQLADLVNESQTLKEIISQLSIKVNQLQALKIKNEQELKAKNRTLDSLNAEMGSLKTQLQQSEAAVIKLQQEKSELRQQLQVKERITANLSRQSIDTASLIEKVNYLEFELGRARRAGGREDTASLEGKLAVQEGKLAAQGQQLTEYRAEIDRLYAQLKTEKSEKHTNVVDQYSLIADLQKTIAQGDIRLLNLQNELHNKEAQWKEELESVKYQNRALVEQLNSKHSQMMGYYEELSRKTQQEEAAARVPHLEQYISELEHKNQQIIDRFSLEANELNSNILALRTSNLALRNDLDNREDLINELKHQLFNVELRTQKEKAPSISNSVASRESEADKIERAEREKQRQKEKEKGEKTLMLLVMLSIEVESLRQKNEELEAMYHQDLDKYREALKQLQARQMELCNSLHLSSDIHESNKAEENIQLSQEAISQFSQNSTAFLTASRKPLEATTAIRSQQAGFLSQQAGLRSEQRSGGEQPSSAEVSSNVSIDASPLKRRGVTVKKIG